MRASDRPQARRQYFEQSYRSLHDRIAVLLDDRLSSLQEPAAEPHPPAGDAEDGGTQALQRQQRATVGTLYHKVRADQLAALAEFEPEYEHGPGLPKARKNRQRQALVSKALLSYEQAAEFSQALPVLSVLRLQLALNHATTYGNLLHKDGLACRIARAAYEAAMDALGGSDPQATPGLEVILQLLRDSVASYELRASTAGPPSDDELPEELDLSDLDENGSPLSSPMALAAAARVTSFALSPTRRRREPAEGSDGEEGEEDAPGAARMTAKELAARRKQRVRRATEAADPGGAAAAAAAGGGGGSEQEHSAGLFDESDDPEPTTAQREMVRGLMRVDRPLDVGRIDDAEIIVPALFELFNMYVEAKAVAAQRINGGKVLFGDQPLSMGDFLLRASGTETRMSWLAFRKFAADFDVCPRLLSTAEMAVVFSVSAQVVLASESGGKPRYRGERPVLAVSSDTHKRSWSNADSPTRRAGQAPPANAPAGECLLSYAQFVDCLGRLAQAAYSQPPHNARYETVDARVHGLFAHHLNLLDGERWRGTVGLGDRLAAGLEPHGGGHIHRAMSKRSLGYNRGAANQAASALDFALLPKTMNLVTQGTTRRALRQIFNFYRRARPGSSAGAGLTFGDMARSNEALGMADVIKFATEFKVMPALVTKQRLQELVMACTKASGQAQLQDRLHFEVLASEGDGEGRYAYAMFVEILARIAEEVFARAEFRQQGLYTSQETRLEALFHHMLLDDQTRWRQNMKAVDRPPGLRIASLPDLRAQGERRKPQFGRPDVPRAGPGSRPGSAASSRPGSARPGSARPRNQQQATPARQRPASAMAQPRTVTFKPGKTARAAKAGSRRPQSAHVRLQGARSAPAL